MVCQKINLLNLEKDDYDLWLDHLVRPFTFSSPFNGLDFVLMLVVVDSSITDDERDTLSRQIIEQGCRYAVCTGHQCSKWDDSIDMAYIATSPDYSPPDDRFVMTTWHENESLEDVIHFFRCCTTFDNFTPHHYLTVILGGDETVREAVSLALQIGFESLA